MPTPTGSALMERLVALCRRRGFIFQSSEIYGGINGFWDYGPLGVELKNNLRDAWWDAMVRNPPPGPKWHDRYGVGRVSAKAAIQAVIQLVAGGGGAEVAARSARKKTSRGKR